MSGENEGLMAAINSGIAEASAPPAEPTAPATTEPTGGDDHANLGDAAGGDTPVDGDVGGVGATPAVADGEGQGAGAPTGEAPGADDTAGDDAVEGAAPRDGDAADKPVDEAGKPPAGGKEPDPLNDPLPNALKRETKERIKTLIGMVKEKDEKLETVTRDHGEIMGMIRETKATPEQYGQALDYIRMVNSGDRAQQEQAFEFMQREMVAMARMLGKTVPGVSFLENHEDLMAEVGRGQLTMERANEIAAARESRKFQQNQAAALQDHQQTTARAQQAVQRGKQELNALGAQLAAVDPAYKAKAAILVQSLKPVFRNIDPSQWAATFKRAYDALPAPAAPPATASPPHAKPAAPASGGGNTPLRASGTAGAAVPAPNSLLDAVNFGIAAARR